MNIQWYFKKISSLIAPNMSNYYTWYFKTKNIIILDCFDNKWIRSTWYSNRYRMTCWFLLDFNNRRFTSISKVVRGMYLFNCTLLRSSFVLRKDKYLNILNTKFTLAGLVYTKRYINCNFLLLCILSAHKHFQI